MATGHNVTADWLHLPRMLVIVRSTKKLLTSISIDHLRQFNITISSELTGSLALKPTASVKVHTIMMDSADQYIQPSHSSYLLFFMLVYLLVVTPVF